MQAISRRAPQVDPVRAAYQRLREAQRRRSFPELAERRDWLERLDKLLVQNQRRIAAAVDADFGGRSRHETLLADVLVTLQDIRFARRHLAEWMRRQPAASNRYFLPSRAWVEPLPKGVIGVIAPWNYPVNLALAPLVGAFAAGNRALLKPSELTPRTSELLAEAVREHFTSEELAVVEGGPDIARAICALPLDHLLFTGSTSVGKLVAEAAAKNLVPVTLELGGKSPALVHPSYPIPKAAERIAAGKLFNAGQTCIAPDYALVPEGREQAFADAFREAAARKYPGLPDCADYTAIVNERHRERLRGLLEDARNAGAQVIALGGEPAKGSRKLAPALVLGATPEMALMQEEIFGPILPVLTYGDLNEAIASINARPKPLAFYYFDGDAERAANVLQRTPSGGACVNDALMHFAQEALPFGGVGASGMGAYHGRAGFETFSHVRAVFAGSPNMARKLQAPPYGRTLDSALAFLIGGIGALRRRNAR